jgi:ATP-binding cassette subfamily F protein 3
MIQISNLTKSYGPQILFENLNLRIGGGERVGLLGRNGSGKTTLFRMILKEEDPDSGFVAIPHGSRIATLNQHIEFSEPTVLGEAALGLSHDLKFQTYLVEKILSGLGFESVDFQKSPTLFSGGYQLRIQLAKALSAHPNMLLLDEPTNYLDIISIRWLTQFLKQFKGEAIIISHDRHFIDTACTHAMGIHRKKIKKIEGHTQKYLDLLDQESQIFEKTQDNKERRIKELEAFVERFRAKASKATQAQSKLKMIEKLGPVETLTSERTMGFTFQYKNTPAKRLAAIHNVFFAYDEDKPLISNFSLEIKQGDRIAIIGKNGRGKSTLLNLIAHELTPQHGSIILHPETKIGHFGQMNINRLDLGNTVVEEIMNANPLLSNTQIRSICGALLFSGIAAEKTIQVLSGGERSRVTLGKIIAGGTNLLLLDEPTNHLDMESIEVLQEKIDDYPGAVIIVTHSEMLLNHLAKRLVVFQSREVSVFEGTYGHFLQDIGWEEENGVRRKKDRGPGLTKKELKAQKAQQIQEKSQTIAPLQKRSRQVEQEIVELEAQKSLLLKDIEIAALHGKTAQLKEQAEDLKTLDATVEKHFQTLEHLEAQIKTATEKLAAKWSSVIAGNAYSKS